MELKDGEISFIELLPVSGNPHSPAQTTKQEETAQASSSAASKTTVKDQTITWSQRLNAFAKSSRNAIVLE